VRSNSSCERSDAFSVKFPSRTSIVDCSWAIAEEECRKFVLGHVGKRRQFDRRRY
jgi:hypothetical protein